MDTKLLHEKIERFSKTVNENKLNPQFAIELIIDLNIWLAGIEKYIGELEFEILIKDDTILSQDVLIDQMQKMLLLTGNGKLLVAGSIMDKQTFDLAVDFLINCKDRINATNIYQIGKLLELSIRQEKEIKDMVQLINYARTGI